MKRNQFLLPLLFAISLQSIGQVTIKKDANKNTAQPVVDKQVNTARIRNTANTSYDFSNVRICVDKISNHPLDERPMTVYRTIPHINSNGQLEQPNTVQQGLSAYTRKMWPTGQIITVAFYPNEASNIVIEKVKKYAQVWESVANVKFNFTDDLHNAMVKIGFTKGGSWSWIGREVTYNPLGQKTMNLGWLDNNTPEEEFSRVVLHEFGHVLGFIHEHQASGANINWDVEKVYAFFAASDGWSRADVDQNIFSKYSQTSTNGTAYDRSSIMHYFFPQGLTTDNSSFTINTTLSPLDKEFARSVYPFPPQPTNATGVLHTGNDCDAIKFTVEYNVVAGNVIEFNLRPGIDDAGKPISWWKQIGIPLKGGGENRELQLLQDGKPTSQTILVTDIDDTRGFSFGKAGTLGIHKGLSFTWNVWQALPGGCRVTFVWQNDHCYN
jgi:serralysin